MDNRSGNDSARQDPGPLPVSARSLPRKIVHRWERLLRRLGAHPPTRRYWESRALEHGMRSVLDLRHTDADVQTVTAAQTDLLFPLLRGCLEPGDHRVLDFGCGPGRFTPGLARLVDGTAMGIDPVGHLLEMAPRDPRVEYRRLVGRRIPASDSFFDVVWVCVVLGGIVHEREIRRVAREITRVLKPRGLLFLVENTSGTPDKYYWKYRTVDDYRRLFPSIELAQISEYTDIDQRMSVLAGRKS